MKMRTTAIASVISRLRRCGGAASGARSVPGVVPGRPTPRVHFQSCSHDDSGRIVTFPNRRLTANT